VSICTIILVSSNIVVDYMNIKIILSVFVFLLATQSTTAATYQQLAMLDGSSNTLLSNKKNKSTKSESFGSSCLRSIEAVKQKATKINHIIYSSAKKHSVDSNLIKAVIAVESCYQRTAVSPAGAQGLMQLIPATAERFGVTDSFDVQQNVNAGTKYLRYLLDRFDGDLQKVTAGYNAGEGRVDQYKGIPPFKETQKYVKNVLRIYKGLSYKKQLTPSPKIKKVANKRPTLKQVLRTKGKAIVKFSLQRSRVAYKQKVRLKKVRPRSNPKPRAMTAKPGRQGWQYNRLRAPQLYRQR